MKLTTCFIFLSRRLPAFGFSRKSRVKAIILVYFQTNFVFLLFMFLVFFFSLPLFAVFLNMISRRKQLKTFVYTKQSVSISVNFVESRDISLENVSFFVNQLFPPYDLQEYEGIKWKIEFANEVLRRVAIEELTKIFSLSRLKLSTYF